MGGLGGGGGIQGEGRTLGRAPGDNGCVGTGRHSPGKEKEYGWTREGKGTGSTVGEILQRQSRDPS